MIGYNNKKWIKIYHKKVHLTYSFEASSEIIKYTVLEDIFKSLNN